MFGQIWVCTLVHNTIINIGEGMDDIGFNQPRLTSNKIYDYNDNRTAQEPWSTHMQKCNKPLQMWVHLTVTKYYADTWVGI